MVDDNKLIPKGRITLEYHKDLYLLVDFLNRNVKDKNLMVGLTKKENKATISLYDF